MKLTDTVTNEVVHLPNDLLWVDEYNWTPVGKTSKYSLAGALIIEQSVRLAGRPITLEPSDDSMAWVTRATVNKLRSMAATLNRKFRLKLEYPQDTREFLVTFAPEDSPIESRPVKPFPEHDSNAWHHIKLKFIEVAE